MSLPQDESGDNLEIVDSGHNVSTRRTEEGKEEFWAVVENSGDTKSVTLQLQLVDERSALARHERSRTVQAGSSQRYRFVVAIPPGFDQYVFSIADRDDAEA